MADHASPSNPSPPVPGPRDSSATPRATSVGSPPASAQSAAGANGQATASSATTAAGGVPSPGTTSARRRRDRRGRGLRGILIPTDVPAYRTRGERFDDLVLEAVEHLDQRWSSELSDVEFAVEDVPPVPSTPNPVEPVPLAYHQPAAGRGRSATPHRIVVYRRPLEARAIDADDLAELVLDVIIHKVADMLGVEPDVIDPEGHGWDDED
jgi:predicted Zn-dependent protease with MMP-like domain